MSFTVSNFFCWGCCPAAAGLRFHGQVSTGPRLRAQYSASLTRSFEPLSRSIWYSPAPSHSSMTSTRRCRMVWACWSASCPLASRGASAYRACVPLLVFGCCRSRCGRGCFPNGCAHPGECRRWQDDRGSFLRRISGQVPVPFPWSSPLSAASLGSKLMIYWWLLISPCWVFLPYLRFASRQAVANEKSPHSRVSSRYDSRSFGSALFIQKLLPGERIVLVNEVRFDGGVVRVFRGDMLERCHTVHPELSRRAAGMRSGLQVRQGVSPGSARCLHRRN